MSVDRIQAEIELLKQRYPEIEIRDGGWCRFTRYSLPDGWSSAEAELAFRIPENLPGEVPYAFWTRPPLTLSGGGSPSNADSPPVETVFGSGWQQWSWQLEDWRPGDTPGAGSNMVDHVRSIGYRLKELN
jgi:hypothetical protein